MNKISAEIIADSKNEYGQRLTSFLVVFPRIVLAEFNTHRMLSRNSASSRAIPFETMLKRLEDEPFIPIRFQKDHSGMQGTEYFEGKEEEDVKHHWVCAKNNAIAVAKQMSEAGITKQLCNRILEPFMYHTVIVTSSEWENFFSLRAHDAAEIHIADLAHKMLDEYNKSTPKQLKAGNWHVPFGDKMEPHRIIETLGGAANTDQIKDAKIKIATARCARVSYLNYEGNDDYEADMKLHDRLSGLGHWSPFEHCARAMSAKEMEDNALVINLDEQGGILEGVCGNLRGFVQYRKTFVGENAPDIRVLKK